MKSKLLLIFTLLASFYTFSQDITWTFDCGSEGWGVNSQPNSFISNHEFNSPSVDSGHLKFVHTQNPSNDQNWLFATQTTINANTNKYIHFSLSIENANIPVSGLNALFVWNNPSGGLGTEVFTIYNGKQTYSIDLSSNASWQGDLSLSRFHFPQGSIAGTGYKVVTAIYRLDWISVSSSATPITPTQDTSMITPQLSNNIETVVFGNRVSIKASYTGSCADASFKMWPIGTTNIISRNQRFENGGIVYTSEKDLDLNTTYEYVLELQNTAGTSSSSIGQFTTESQNAELQPDNFWIGATPWNLIENANDHLMDNDTWPQAAAMSHVYKIHGATFKASIVPEFYSYVLPKLIFTCNKYRMRIAIEDVFEGQIAPDIFNSGQNYADLISSLVDKVNNIGGKVEFFTWDGMMLRSFYSPQNNTVFRTPDVGMEAIAEATKLLKEKYPELEIIPLPNLPNSDTKDTDGSIIPDNAGNWTESAGVESWNYLCDLYLNKLASKGASINRIEIDHPYFYYTKNGSALGEQRLTAFKAYCISKNLKLGVIVNQSVVGSGDNASQDAAFKQGCVDYMNEIINIGINPEHIDLESWYKFPQYLTPETKENSFTNVVKAVGDILSPTLHIDKKTIDKVHVYPNPTSNSLNIKIPSYFENTSFKIIDIIGKSHYIQQNINSDVFELSVENLANGLYFLNVSTKNTNQTHKFLVKH